MANDLTLSLRITADGKAAVTELNGVAIAEQRLGAGAEDAAKHSRGLAESLSQYAGAAVSVGALVAAIKTLGTTLMEVQGQRMGLAAVLGSDTGADASMEETRAQADRLGVEIGRLTQSWIDTAAAAKGTELEGAKIADVFDSVVSVGAKLGTSQERIQNGLLAVAQMAAKGVISMEELRGQLSEAIPGAAQAMASGLGVSLAELNKLVESGTLAASEALPALAKGLRATFDVDANERIENLSASVARLSNAFRALQEDIGDAGGGAVLQGLADGATALLSAVEG